MSRRTPAHGEKRSPSWCPTPRVSRPRILGRRPPPGRGNAPPPQPHARTRRRRRTTTRQLAATDQAGTDSASRLRIRPPGGSGIRASERRDRGMGGSTRGGCLAAASAERGGLAPGPRPRGVLVRFEMGWEGMGGTGGRRKRSGRELGMESLEAVLCV